MIGTVPPADPTAFIRARLPVLPVPVSIRVQVRVPVRKVVVMEVQCGGNHGDEELSSESRLTS